MVRRIMDAPPVWLAGSYIAAWRSGRFSTKVLACGVTAGLGRSAYDGAVVDEVMEILIDMGYGAEGVAAVWA